MSPRYAWRPSTVYERRRHTCVHKVESVKRLAPTLRIINENIIRLHQECNKFVFVAISKFSIPQARPNKLAGLGLL